MRATGGFEAVLFDMRQKQEANRDLRDGGARHAQADVKESSRLNAHEISDGDADQKCRTDALCHDERRAPEAVEKADEAKEEAGKQAVDG